MSTAPGPTLAMRAQACAMTRGRRPAAVFRTNQLIASAFLHSRGFRIAAAEMICRDLGRVSARWGTLCFEAAFDLC
jgi:hypothetical protein